MTDPHPASAESAYLSCDNIAELFADGRLTSVQLVRTLLERIEAIDTVGTEVGLNAIAQVAEDAVRVAQECDDERVQGVSRGPLHGIPVLVKDNVEVEGLSGLAGSTALIGRPTRDAPLVGRLRAAGAIVLASTNLSQWANIRSPRSTSGYSSTAGLVGNPWALDRSAGGSSSGSGAALAAGLAPLAVGTETDGSITCPASVNGVVGLKPTVGTVPTQYVVPISASQDSPGPMARSVSDVALLYGVLAQSEPPAEVLDVTFAVATNYRTDHPQTDKLFDTIVEALRASDEKVVDREVALPGESEGHDELAVMLAELVDAMTVYLLDRPGEGVRSLTDVVAYEDEHADVEQVYFGHELFTMAVETGGRTGEAYAGARARNLTWAVETCLTPALEGVDVLLAPAYGPAWKSDLAVGGHPGPASPATMAPAIAGWPIMCVPIGLIQDLPIGLAIIGRPQSEWTLIEAARRIEALVARNSPMPLPLWKPATRG
jgi:amidase